MFDCEEGGATRLGRARAVLSQAEARVGLASDARGGVWQCGDDRLDLYRRVAQAMGNDGWCVVVNLVDVGWLAAAQQGVALDRVIYVPDSCGSDVAVLAASIDAAGVVVADVQLPVGAARRLAARAHARGTWVFTQAPWAGARGVGQRDVG